MLVDTHIIPPVILHIYHTMNHVNIYYTTSHVMYVLRYQSCYTCITLPLIVLAGMKVDHPLKVMKCICQHLASPHTSLYSD